TPPYVYQLINGEKVELEGKFKLFNKNMQPAICNSFKFGFEIIGKYNRSYPLIIDPTLEYSTFLGGGDEDMGRGIAVDSTGVYVSGLTQSSDFPTTVGAYKTSPFGNWDVFITKLTLDGSSLIYSTYLGGSAEEGYWADTPIAIDSSGNAYITGYTCSIDFPTAPTGDVYQPKHADSGTTWDTFVTKLNDTGDELVYSTYLGGVGGEAGFGIAVDDSGRTYVAGRTNSDDFPTKNAYQKERNDNEDIFVTKFNSDGNNLVYSTYLGGSNYDHCMDVAVDSLGNAYVTGHTISDNFPTLNPYQGRRMGSSYDNFVSKFDPSGNLLYSTYLGGTGYDWARCIAVDGSENVYISGRTMSSDFPTVNPYQGSLNGTVDAFITKFNSTWDTLIFSTYLGGTADEHSNGIVVDSSGCVYITGYTASGDFPTQNPYQGNNGGGDDSFLAKFNASGDVLLYSTYLGGSDGDIGNGVTIDSSGCVYITGYTASGDFPTQNPYQGTYNGNNDAFVAKFGFLSPGTYYVMPDGDDANDGTSNTPSGAWRSLHHAISEINAGFSGSYTLRVAAGTYSVPNEIDSPLTVAQDNLVVQGDSGGGTIVDGAGTVYWKNGIEINASGVSLLYLEICNFNMNGIKINSGSGNLIDNCEVHENENGIYISSSSSNNTIRNDTEIYRNGGAGIVIDNSSGNRVYQCLGSIYDNDLCGVDIEGLSSTNNEIYNNRIYWTGDPGWKQQYGIYLSHVGSGNSIHNNEIYGHSSFDYAGIKVEDCSPSIEKNRVYDNFVGIDVDASTDEASPYICNNFIYDTGSTIQDYGIYLSTSGYGYGISSQIYHNTIKGGVKSGIWMGDDSLISPEIKYNIIVNFGEYGIYCDGAGSASPTIEYNDVWGNTPGGYFQCSGSSDISSDPSFETDDELSSNSPCIDQIPSGDPV
ncbi:MAG: hypothetical protein DRO36_07275, partial [Candidatus Hecatellales archaeon]